MKRGPLFEKQGVEYLNASFDTDSIERRVMGGTKDRGDVSGVFFQGKPFVIEFKNVKTLRPKQYFAELETECGNDDTDLGAIVFHRDGFGEKHMGGQGVLMTFETLVKLLGGNPPKED
jgi:hypothetical protein